VKIDAAVHEEMKLAKRSLYEQHRDDPNFTGCGIGFRRRDGKVTDELVVIAMVADKLPAGAVSQRRLLPATVSGATGTYGVDVVQAGPIYAGAAPHPAAAMVGSPIGGIGGPITETFAVPLQGCSISNGNPAAYPDNTAHGTFGCLVEANGDGSIGMLSATPVLSALGASQALTHPIVQPATVANGSSAFATLYSSVQLQQSPGVNQVDVAMAKLDSQNTYTQNVAGDLMAPISSTHQAVGIALAWDLGGDSFLCRMDLALQQLNCQLMAGPNAVATPEIGANIEKVGRTSGYTSSTIDAIDVQVEIHYTADTQHFPNTVNKYEFDDLIWSQYLMVDGDRGAVACIGGDGATLVSYPPASNCPLLATTQSYYALPNLTSDNQLTNEVQSKFLSQSQTGTLFIGAVYLNMNTFVTRLQQETGTAYSQATAQAAAQAYYNNYRDLIATEMATPNSTTTVSSTDANDAINLVLDITGYKYDSTTSTYSVTGPYTVPEAQNAWVITYLLGTGMVNMTMQQAIAYMAEGSIYEFVYNTLLKVPTIELP